MSVRESLRTLAMALGADGTAKSIKGHLSEISVALGGSGTGRTVSELIDEIAAEKNDLLGMTVDFNISDSTDLLGKYVYELQENVSLTGNKITGTLLKVEDYTGFSGDPVEQKGNYIAIHCSVPGVNGATIKFISKSGKKYVVDPSDGLIVLRMAVKPTKFRFEISKDGIPTVEKTFDASGLVLEKTVRPTPNQVTEPVSESEPVVEPSEPESMNEPNE